MFLSIDELDEKIIQNASKRKLKKIIKEMNKYVLCERSKVLYELAQKRLNELENE